MKVSLGRFHFADFLLVVPWVLCVSWAFSPELWSRWVWDQLLRPWWQQVLPVKSEVSPPPLYVLVWGVVAAVTARVWGKSSRVGANFLDHAFVVGILGLFALTTYWATFDFWIAAAILRHTRLTCGSITLSTIGTLR